MIYMEADSDEVKEDDDECCGENDEKRPFLDLAVNHYNQRRNYMDQQQQ